MDKYERERKFDGIREFNIPNSEYRNGATHVVLFNAWGDGRDWWDYERPYHDLETRDGGRLYAAVEPYGGYWVVWAD